MCRERKEAEIVFCKFNYFGYVFNRFTHERCSDEFYKKLLSNSSSEFSRYKVFLEVPTFQGDGAVCVKVNQALYNNGVLDPFPPGFQWASGIERRFQISQHLFIQS